MPRRRRLSIVLGVVLAMIVVVSAIGIGWLSVTLRPVGEFLEHGYLGEPGQRQRIEVTDHGFAISFADDWIVEEQARDTVEAEGSVLREVSIARFEQGMPRCAVDAVVAGGPADGVAILQAWAGANAERLEIDVCDEAECDASRVNLAEGVVATTYLHATGAQRVGWYVTLADSAVLVRCVHEEGTSQGADAELATHQGLFVRGMLPIIASIESLPAAPPGATDVNAAPGRRAETVGGFAITLPEGWTSLPPEPDGQEEALLLFLERLWPWRSSPSVTVVGPRPDDGEDAVESCTLDEVVLAGYMNSWDEASLESIAALVEWVLADAVTSGAKFDPGSTTYLDLPAGRVARLDVSSSETYRSVYMLPQDKSLFLLACEGPEQGLDRWDSLAKTIELLPERDSR